MKTTAHAYDPAGSLTKIIYSEGTPGVANTYDRLGRLISVSSGPMTDTLTYNLANEMLGESFTGGPLSGLSVTDTYDQFLRRTNLTALAGASTLSSTAYGYDNAFRLQTVNDGNNDVAKYSYLANSPLVGQTCPVRFQVASGRRACLVAWTGTRCSALGGFISRGKPLPTGRPP